MQMEEVREVIDAAAEFLSVAIPIPRGDIFLEQIEEKPSAWSVVLSYPAFGSKPGGTWSLSSRIYKELVVDGGSKEVKAMKFWKAS